MAQVTVGLDPELAAAYIEGDRGSPGANDLEGVVRHLGAELAPQAPGLRTADIEPGSDEVVWFTCQVDDQRGAESAGRLLEVEGVRAAYVVPPEGPP